MKNAIEKTPPFASARNLMAASSLCLLGTCVHAQSSVDVYGLLETGVRYGTNVNARGDSQTTLADGLIHPSRLGFKGKEDLGAGLQAVFGLEAGLILKNGASFNGSVGYANDSAAQARLFGREAYVGIQGDFGTVKLGRQYTTAYVQTWDFDPIYGGGLVAYAPYIFYTGVRQDNVLTYEKASGPLTVRAHYTFGEQSGSRGNGAGLGLSYSNDGLGFSAAVQESNNSRLGAPAKEKVAVLGGSYATGPLKVTLGYIKNSYDGIAQKNDVLVASATYALSTPWTFTVVANLDKQRDADGRQLFAVALAEYALSKRTATFVALDYHKYRDALLPYGPGGKDQQSGLTLGIRHSF